MLALKIEQAAGSSSWSMSINTLNLNMATSVGLVMQVLVLLCFTTGALGRSEMCTIFKSAEAYNRLTNNQKSCAAGTISSVGWMSTCKDKVCFSADPQWISDETDRCMLALGTIDGMYSADTYNGIMAFFANECGTFQAQFKVIPSPSDPKFLTFVSSNMRLSKTHADRDSRWQARVSYTPLYTLKHPLQRPPDKPKTQVENPLPLSP
jgi:hypothetical protein